MSPTHLTLVFTSVILLMADSNKNTSNTYCLQCTEHKAVVLALEELTVFSAAPEFIGVIGTLR